MNSVERRGSTSRQIKTHQRRAYDANFKIAVANYAGVNGNHSAAEKYGVDRRSVRLWRKQLPLLLKTSASRCAFRGPTSGRYTALEERVVRFVRENRRNGLAVSRRIICTEAGKIACEMGMSREDFHASSGWLRRMMKRNGFSLRRRTTVAQRLPEFYEEKMLSFQRFVIHLRQRQRYLLGQIGNADQTPIYFDMPSSTTVEERGSKSVAVKTTGNEKTRITCMLGITADGRKLPPYVIFKRKTIPKDKFPPGICIRAQEKGWMTEDLVRDWVKVVWQKRPGALLNIPSMLVLDSFKGHVTEKVKKDIRAGNTDLVIVPGGMTSLLQPLDVSINKPFKDRLKERYAQWMLEGEKEYTPSGKMKKPSLGLISQWVLKSWNSIPEEIVTKSFKKCCISNSLDGTEDDFIWMDSDDDDKDWSPSEQDESDMSSERESEDV